MQNTSLQILLEGCEVLNAYLRPRSFEFLLVESGPSSGGDYAFGYFINGNRKLQVHHRDSLGLVTYHYGELSVDHDSYMRAVLGAIGGNRYPGFSAGRLSAFEDLRFDLEHFANDFVMGDAETFARHVEIAEKWKQTTGFARLP